MWTRRSVRPSCRGTNSTLSSQREQVEAPPAPGPPWHFLQMTLYRRSSRPPRSRGSLHSRISEVSFTLEITPRGGDGTAAGKVEGEGSELGPQHLPSIQSFCVLQSTSYRLALVPALTSRIAFLHFSTRKTLVSLQGSTGDVTTSWKSSLILFLPVLCTPITQFLGILPAQHLAPCMLIIYFHNCFSHQVASSFRTVTILFSSTSLAPGTTPGTKVQSREKAGH